MKLDVPLGTLDAVAGIRPCGTADGFVFTSLITPTDHVSGQIITALDQVSAAARRACVGRPQFDIAEEPVIAQTWAVYQLLSTLLEAEGSGLDHLVRQRLFIRDRNDIPAIERTLDLVLGPHRPATSIVLVNPRGLDPATRICIDAIAVETGRSDLAPAPTGPRPNPYDLVRFPAAVRAGNFVFFSMLVGTEERSGKIVHSPTQIPGLHPEAYRDRFFTALAWSAFCETYTIFSRLASLLQGLGGSLADLVKVNGWTSFPSRIYAAVATARELLLDDDPRAKPASTGLFVGDVPHEEASLGFDAVAYLAGGAQGKRVATKPAGLGEHFYSPAVEAGSMVFTCGAVPVDLSVAKPVTSCSQLVDEGRLLRMFHPNVEAGYQAKAWYTYKSLIDYLRPYGRSLSDTIHQTIYLSDITQAYAVERVASSFFGHILPATSYVPITLTSPFDQTELEIDLVVGRASSSPESRGPSLPS